MEQPLEATLTRIKRHSRQSRHSLSDCATCCEAYVATARQRPTVPGSQATLCRQIPSTWYVQPCCLLCSTVLVEQACSLVVSTQLARCIKALPTHETLGNVWHTYLRCCCRAWWWLLLVAMLGGRAFAGCCPPLVQLHCHPGAAPPRPSHGACSTLWHATRHKHS